ncbi:MAG: S8 family serine peptidase [Elusimicrobia bacterium]|nr:S8 family serine peptidase [Elusimicrobiota bacterium]
MKTIKTTLSLIICACMLGVTPGFDCYRAAAAVVQTQVQAVPANAGMSAVGASLTNTGGMTAAPSISLTGTSLSGTLNANSPVPQLKSQILAAPMQTAVPVTAQSPVTAAPQAGVTPIIIREAVIQAGAHQAAGLVKALPKAEPGQAQNGLVWGAFTQLQRMVLSFTKSKGSKGMPDYDRGSDDHISDPDGSGGGIDPLGNPSRDPNRDTGPDSRDSGDSWDGGGRSGGSELFKGLSFSKSSKGSKGMPDYDRGSDDRVADPDGSGSGIDPLGNPSRDPNRDTGPDSRDSGDSWDGGGRSGGSELFKSPVTGLSASISLFAPAGVPANTAAAPVSLDNRPVDLIVMFGDTAKPLTRDEHLSLVDVNQRGGVSLYAFAQQRIMMQLGNAGLEADTMAAYNATPIATYARINAATIRVEAGRAAEFRALLEGRGFKVYDNARRHIVEPVPVKPEDMDPVGRGAVGMDENLKISKADTVQALAKKVWGAPELGFWGRLVLRLFGAAIPQPAVGVIDTGADVNHPLLKRLKALVNATSGPNIDDNGHGSWVTSMILNFAPWLKNLTHYKVFTADGGATLDDILKALTMAGNDGNLIVSNSWGDDQGDPQGPDAQLVRKLAQEGHIMVFAAGNAGPRANTVGAPAIVSYKDAKTGAIRVVSVAATDRAKKVAYFSSRGPGSPMTSHDPNYKDHRPDLSAVGYNTEGAWPTTQANEADRVDPVFGPLKAISGTSMATPAVAGALALLAMVFGVTTIGEKLDAIVNGVMSTLVKTGQSADAEGQGFIDLDAAFKAISQVMTPVIPSFAARAVVSLAARSQARQARLRAAAAIPEGAVWEYRALGHMPRQIQDTHLRMTLDQSIARSDAEEYKTGEYEKYYTQRHNLLTRYPELPLRTSLLGRLQLALGGGR